MQLPDATASLVNHWLRKHGIRDSSREQGDRAELARSARACYEAPSADLARVLAEDFERNYQSEFPSAMACFKDDFEACIAHLRFPLNHRQVIRTANLTRSIPILTIRANRCDHVTGNFVEKFSIGLNLGPDFLGSRSRFLHGRSVP